MKQKALQNLSKYLADYHLGIRIDLHLIVYSHYKVYKISLRTFSLSKGDYKKIDSMEFRTSRISKAEMAEEIKSCLRSHEWEKFYNPVIKKLSELECLEKAEAVLA